MHWWLVAGGLPLALLTWSPHIPLPPHRGMAAGHLWQPPARAKPLLNPDLPCAAGKVVFRGQGIEVYPDWWKSTSRSGEPHPPASGTSPLAWLQGQAVVWRCVSAWHGPWSLALPLMSAVGTPCARRPAADTWAMQAAIDSCSQQACTLLHSRTLFATEGGVYLHNRVRFFSTAKANIHSLGGNGEAQGLRRVGGEWLKYRPQCACLGLASPRGTVACPGCTAGSLSQPARWQTAKRVHCAGCCRHRWVLRLSPCMPRVACRRGRDTAGR